MKPRTGILIVMLLVLGASSAATEEPRIAKVENYGDKLVFVPVVSFEQLVLTVTGPCSYEYEKVVSEGDVSFRLDETTIDGAYTYQLVRIEEISSEVIEALEMAYPVRLVEYSVRRGSGGDGRHRGGDGICRAWEFLAPATVSLLTDRRRRRPWGLAGGEPGEPGRDVLRHASGQQVELPPEAVHRRGAQVHVRGLRRPGHLAGQHGQAELRPLGEGRH